MTLYLSRLRFEPRHPQTRSELDRPYELHRTLSRAYDDLKAARPLFRAERDNPADPIVIVQSRLAPNWEAALAHMPHLRDHACKEFGLLGLAEGQRMNFRLLCRPSKRLRRPSESAGGASAGVGSRVVLTEANDLFAWLGRQGDRSGFEVVEASFDRSYWLDSRSEARASGTGVRRDRTPVPMRMKTTQEPLLGAVRFDGVLLVTDADKLREAVANGIGQQKAFGFGLLSLAPGR